MIIRGRSETRKLKNCQTLHAVVIYNIACIMFSCITFSCVSAVFTHVLYNVRRSKIRSSRRKNRLTDFACYDKLINASMFALIQQWCGKRGRRTEDWKRKLHCCLFAYAEVPRNGRGKMFRAIFPCDFRPHFPMGARSLAFDRFRDSSVARYHIAINATRRAVLEGAVNSTRLCIAKTVLVNLTC